jgi:MFS family permease
MMAAFAYPLWVFLARTIDRLGKGIRTGARDALLSAEATVQTKGRVFGFHRAMDTLGAVAGPSLALIYLFYFPQQYKMLFVIALIPGVLAFALTLLLKETTSEEKVLSKEGISFLVSFQYWKESPLPYKRLLIGLLFFTLFNSSDLFLLLGAKEAGLGDSAVIGIYIFYNLAYAAFAYPLGSLSDKIGFRKMLVLGFFIFMTVYAGMAFNDRIEIFYLLFLLYGLYAAATESVGKAWITNICKKEDTATAIGTFTGFQSICTMMASSLAGGLWLAFGATATFLITAAAALVVVVYFFLLRGKPG